MSPLWRIAILCLITLLIAIILQFRGFLQPRDVYFISLVFLAVLLAPYALLPFMLHRNLWVAADQDYEIFDPDREVVPEEVWIHIRQAVAKLKPCGLNVIAHFRRSRHVPGATTYATLMQTTDGIIFAKAVTVIIRRKSRLLTSSSLAFSTESEDGTEILTSNNITVGHTPQPKKRAVLWLPDVRNPCELYEFHQHYLDRFNGRLKRRILDGKAVEYMNEYAEAELVDWVKRGYYRSDSAGEVFRLTLKGAVLAAWTQLWPIKPIQAVLRRYQTKKLLRKLEE